MNEITQTSESNSKLIEALRNSFYPEASVESVIMAVRYCLAAGLDPMTRPVHIVPIWSESAGRMIDTVMPGVALYRIKASRTGAYAGKTEPEFGPDVTDDLDGVRITYPAWCRVTVRRLVGGSVREFSAKEFWLENYATAKRNIAAPNRMWKKRPYGQLAKCAEAQALRMAFPEETGGTNTAEEMEGKLLPDEPVQLCSAEQTPRREPERAAIAAPTATPGADTIQVGVDALLEKLECVMTLNELNELSGSEKVTKQRTWLANKRPDLATLVEEAISVALARVTADQVVA